MTSKEKIEQAWELINSKHIETNEEIQLVRYAVRIARDLVGRDTLQQAKQQEKLLALYREKEKHEQEFPALNNIEHEDYQRIKTKIRELENNE